MKRKIKIVDKIDKTEKIIEWKDRDPELIHIFEKNRSSIYRNKKKYNRKEKHKKPYD